MLADSNTVGIAAVPDFRAGVPFGVSVDIIQCQLFVAQKFLLEIVPRVPSGGPLRRVTFFTGLLLSGEEPLSFCLMIWKHNAHRQRWCQLEASHSGTGLKPRRDLSQIYVRNLSEVPPRC